MENKLQNAGQNSIMRNYVKTDNILKDMCVIIESSQKSAYQAVNTLLVQRNWLLGYRIASEEMQGNERAKYGAETIKNLQKNYQQNMEKDLQSLTCTVSSFFIRLIRRFSRHRLENLKDCFLGHIMQYCCK